MATRAHIALLVLAVVALFATCNGQVATFALYAKQGRNNPYTLTYGDTDSVEMSCLNPGNTLVVLVHDYSSLCVSAYPAYGASDYDTSELRTAIFNEGPYDVLEVTWNDAVSYRNAVNKINSAGKAIGELLSFIESTSKGLVLSIYIIGRGVGAHIAGRAGKQYTIETGRMIHRITGLDPSYSKVSGNKIMRQTDANYVDIIMTNRGTLDNCYFGHLKAGNDIDIRVNGGQTQSVCASGLIGCCRDPCHHIFAYYAFLASVSDQSVMINTCDGNRLATGTSTGDVFGFHMLSANSVPASATTSPSFVCVDKTLTFPFTG